MLSLITINFNNATGLERTIASVQEQNKGFKFEHIIVDGASTDHSSIIIEQYTHALNNVISISEKDTGIYNAMNKGVRLASGSHIAFLNSGDVLANNNVLNNIGTAISGANGADFVYGDIRFVNVIGKVVRAWRAGSFRNSKLYYGWIPPHPMTTVRKNIIDEVGHFDEDFKISADYDIMLRILTRPQILVRYLAETVVYMEPGGVSNGSLKGIIKSNYEVCKSWYKCKGIVFPYWIIFTKPLSKIVQLRK